MLTVRKRIYHRVLSLNGPPTQIGFRLQSRAFHGGLLVPFCCAPAAAVGFLPALQSPKSINEGNGTTNTFVVDRNTEQRVSVRRKLVRALVSLIKAVEVLLRVARIGLLFSPVILSGWVTSVIQRSRVFPEELSENLCDWWWGLLLNVLDLSGPTLVKAAQWASTRQDMFPKELCARLARIHTFTRRTHIRVAEDALDQAFGSSWRRFFALQDEQLGSGCVASVFKGHMIAGKNAGKQIAVKVLHRDVKRAIRLDLAFMQGAAKAAEMLPFVRWEWLSLGESVDEFASLMEMQMDLSREAVNLERFIQDFEDNPAVVFPRPLYPWVSDNVLVEDFLDGKPISNFFPSKKLAEMGLQAFLRMLFVTNFVHGDLHPGNLMVREKENGEPCLQFLDAGIVCELDGDDRQNFWDLFYAVAVGDGKLAGSLMIERARHHRCMDPEGFCEGVDDLVQGARSRGLRLGQIQAGELLARVSQLCLKHEVKLESKFARLLIAIAVLEGVGRSLDADCNILGALTETMKSRITK